jgi:hypothetical protein
MLEQFQEKWEPVFRSELRKNKELGYSKNGIALVIETAGHRIGGFRLKIA